ncbi:hypothetical protein EVAR_10833_1 [Eumeta japonica]|uniref:Uncharacterized protein n=1 Tax=Eumeta variegata TaxID=151549 RepID=A0A4C1YAG6_EUMVA|nr:hypothetical protein EVAR_10833_1 [Eumeta japonica]
MLCRPVAILSTVSTAGAEIRAIDNSPGRCYRRWAVGALKIESCRLRSHVTTLVFAVRKLARRNVSSYSQTRDNFNTSISVVPCGPGVANGRRRVQCNARNCRSVMPANYAMRRCNAPRPFLLLPRDAILRRRDAFVANFTAA